MCSASKSWLPGYFLQCFELISIRTHDGVALYWLVSRPEMSQRVVWSSPLCVGRTRFLPSSLFVAIPQERWRIFLWLLSHPLSRFDIRTLTRCWTDWIWRSYKIRICIPKPGVIVDCMEEGELPSTRSNTPWSPPTRPTVPPPGLSYGTQSAAGVAPHAMVWYGMAPHAALLGTIMASSGPAPVLWRSFKLAILTVVLSIHNPHQHALKMKCRVGILCLCSHCPPYLIQRGEGDDPMLYKLLQKGCASHSMSTVDQNHPSRPSKSVVSRLLGIFNEQPDMYYHSKALSSIYLDCFYGPI